MSNPLIPSLRDIAALLHKISAGVEVRTLLKGPHLTAPLRESLTKKLMTDRQVSDQAADGFEKVALLLRELGDETVSVFECKLIDEDALPTTEALRTSEAQDVGDVARANAFYEEEWDTCQPTRTLAALVKLIVEVRRETAQLYLRRERATPVQATVCEELHEHYGKRLQDVKDQRDDALGKLRDMGKATTDARKVLFDLLDYIDADWPSMKPYRAQAVVAAYALRSEGASPLARAMPGSVEVEETADGDFVAAAPNACAACQWCKGRKVLGPPEDEYVCPKCDTDSSSQAVKP